MIEEPIKTLQEYCPHYISIGLLYRGCLLGRNPNDCQTCDCSDKKIIEVIATSSTTSYDTRSIR
jgi:hypothetical protein